MPIEPEYDARELGLNWREAMNPIIVPVYPRAPKAQRMNTEQKHQTAGTPAVSGTRALVDGRTPRWD